MQGTIAKLTVVASVVGFGLLALLQVNGFIQESQTAPADESVDEASIEGDLGEELFVDDEEDDSSSEMASQSAPPQNQSEPDGDDWAKELLETQAEPIETAENTVDVDADETDDIFSQFESSRSETASTSGTVSLNDSGNGFDEFDGIEFAGETERDDSPFPADDIPADDESVESATAKIDDESDMIDELPATALDETEPALAKTTDKKRPAIDDSGLIEIDPETGEDIQPVAHETDDETGPQLFAAETEDEPAADDAADIGELPAATKLTAAADEFADDQFPSEPNRLNVDRSAQPLNAADEFGDHELPRSSRRPQDRSRPGKVRVVNENDDPFESDRFPPSPSSAAEKPALPKSNAEPALPEIEPGSKNSIVDAPADDNPFDDKPADDVESDPFGDAPADEVMENTADDDGPLPAFDEPSDSPAFPDSDSDSDADDATVEPEPITPLEQFPRNEQPVRSRPPVKTQEPNEELLPPQKIPSRTTDNSSPAKVTEGIDGDATVDQRVPQGVLRPHLTIEKVAPKNAVLGKPMVYQIVVKNQGDAAAHQVVVEDRIPRGSQLSGTDPQAVLADRKLVWDLGTLDAGETRTIAVRVVPTTEGSIGSVATVNFVAEVTAETMITAPKLELELSGPPTVNVGQTVAIRFKLTNMGNSVADKVYIREVIPAGFEHPSGADLEYEVGGLPPGESREVDLRLKAVKPGSYTNRAVATAEGGWEIETKLDIAVLGPQLTITRDGPSRRTVGRPAEYTNTIQNDGERAVRDVSIEEALPEGMEFVEASDGGQYNAEQRVVIWRLDELPAGGQHAVTVVLTPRSRGAMESTVRVIDSRGIPVQVRATTDVVGYSSLSVDTTALDGPIHVGENVGFRVQIRNRGTAPATNVDVRMHIPPGLEFVTARGLTQDNATETVVSFVPVERLGPDENLEFELVFRSLDAGDARVKIDVKTDQMQRPLSREEAVVIFSEEK